MHHEMNGQESTLENHSLFTFVCGAIAGAAIAIGPRSARASTWPMRPWTTREMR
jgi:hypothetical protein